MKERFTILMILALAVGVLAPTAHAGLVLTLDDSVNPVLTINDGDGDGLVTFNGAIGAWVTNITTGISKPLAGTLSEAILHLNSVDVTSAVAGILTITLIDDGYTLVPAPSNGWASLTSEVSVTTAGTAWFEQTYEELSGAAVSLAHGPFVDGSFAETLTAAVPYSGAFSLKEVAVITHAGPGITSFDFESTVVPVPAAVLLGFLGLGAAGLKLRRFA